MREKIVGLKELRENMESYISQVEKGKSFLIVRKSKPIFKVVPIEEENDEKWETMVDFTKIRKGGVPIEEVLKNLRILNEQDSKIS